MVVQPAAWEFRYGSFRDRQQLRVCHAVQSIWPLIYSFILFAENIYVLLYIFLDALCIPAYNILIVFNGCAGSTRQKSAASDAQPPKQMQ